MDMEAIIEEGRQAYRDGKGTYQCPYGISLTEKRIAWFQGYKEEMAKDRGTPIPSE